MTMDDAAAAPPEPEKSSKTKTIVGGIITLIVLILVFGIVLPQFGDYDQAWAAIKAMSTAALVILFLMIERFLVKGLTAGGVK